MPCQSTRVVGQHFNISLSAEKWHQISWGIRVISTGPASCSARSEQTSCSCQPGCQPTWRPSELYILRQAGQRLRLIRSFATKHPLAPSGLTCRPRLLPMPASGQSVAETLQAMEVRWVASMQPSSRGTARLSSGMSASLPAWMTPLRTPRMHWSDRQQQRQEQHQQQTQQQSAPQLPLDRAAADDIIDVLEACGSYAQQAQWRHIWESASASYLDRQHRVLW